MYFAAIVLHFYNANGVAFDEYCVEILIFVDWVADEVLRLWVTVEFLVENFHESVEHCILMRVLERCRQIRSKWHRSSYFRNCALGRLPARLEQLRA